MQMLQIQTTYPSVLVLEQDQPTDLLFMGKIVMPL
jgi:hypothetical protein